MSIQLTPKQVLEFVILGIKNGKLQAAIDLAQDCVDQLEDDTENSVQNPNEERKKNDET